MALTAFLACLAVGVGALVTAFGVARTHWRRDIPRPGARTFAFHVLLRPASYVDAAHLRRVRLWSAVGFAAVLAALAVAPSDVVRSGG